MSPLPNSDVAWFSLAEALRLELQEYGGLINLLKSQQEGIFGRDPEGLHTVNLAIEEQMRTTGRLRAERERLVSTLALAYGQEAATPPRQLFEVFPQTVRPLLIALVDEINRICAQARKLAKQNQMLLTQACALTEDLLRTLQPGAVGRTYGPRGRAQYRAPEASASRHSLTA